jgi:mono/diheme cytochrome c family protein
MRLFARFPIALLLLFAVDRPATPQDATKGKPARTAADSSSVERGKYIVESVAMCGRCHTRGNQAGEAQHQNWLLGGPTQMQATYPVADWAVVEPRIAGRPPGTDAEFVTLLTTGISRTGFPPKPPMPSFRMTRADAEAVLAYLKSLR